MRTHVSTLLAVGMLCLAVGLKWSQMPLLTQMQLATFDSFQRYFPRAYTEQPVRIIDIDNESLEKLGQWPWPRTKIAEMMVRLQQAGTAAVGLDIVFAEPDRTSPQQILPLWGEKAQALRDIATRLPDHDALLADTMREHPVVTGFVMIQEPTVLKPERKAGFSFTGEDPVSSVAQFTGSVVTLPALQQAAAGNGALNSIPDMDGMIRKVPLLLVVEGQLYPSLVSELLRVVQGARSYLVKTVGASSEQAYGQGHGMTHVKIGDFEVPTDAHGALWLHYTAYKPERYVPAWKLFEEGFDAGLVEGHIVLIGTSAAGLKDIRSTPLNPVTSGVEIHAQALEQILAGSFVQRPDWAEGAELLLMGICGLVLIITLTKLGAVWGALLAGMVVTAAIGVSWLGFVRYGLLIDPVYASLAIGMVYLTLSLGRYIATEREKQQVRHAFSHYMSPALVDELAANPQKLKLGGEMKEMTVLFCDIRGFTTISEGLNAEELTGFINRFLTPMTDIILRERGTIDKYMGDAIMAFWNAPLDDEEHALHGCKAALHMFTRLESLNREREEEALRLGTRHIPIHIGAGLNSGEMCVGNMGSDQRFDYSVLGDDVNLASRLEGQSKTYGVDIVLGEKTHDKVPGLATLELDLITVKGKTKPVRIFALLGDETLAQDKGFLAFLETYQHMLAAYRAQQFDKAAAQLQEVRKHYVSLSGKFALEGVLELYEERLKEFQQHPPAKDWDGVYIATSK